MTKTLADDGNHGIHSGSSNGRSSQTKEQASKILRETYSKERGNDHDLPPASSMLAAALAGTDSKAISTAPTATTPSPPPIPKPTSEFVATARSAVAAGTAGGGMDAEEKQEESNPSAMASSHSNPLSRSNVSPFPTPLSNDPTGGRTSNAPTITTTVTTVAASRPQDLQASPTTMAPPLSKSEKLAEREPERKDVERPLSEQPPPPSTPHGSDNTAMTTSGRLDHNININHITNQAKLHRSGLLFHQIDDPEFQRFCQRLRKKLNHDPWDEFKRYDDGDVKDYIATYPDTCGVKYDFDSFSGHIYPLSMLCSLGASVQAVEGAYLANPDALHDCDLWIGTPLHYACSYKAPTPVVEFLISKRPQALEIMNHFGRTPLHMACLFRAKPSTISLLLQQSPDAVKIADKDGYTPLHLACENGATPETIQLLVDLYPASVLAKTRYDSTPLHFACSKAPNKAVIQILLDCNKEALKHMDLMGQTPMHMAAGGGASAAVVQLLVAADPGGIDAMTDKGETPLRIARRKTAPNAVLQLLTPR
jgi:hypothetical protein